MWSLYMNKTSAQSNTCKWDRSSGYFCKTSKGDLKCNTQLGSQLIRYTADNTMWERNDLGICMCIIKALVFSNRSLFLCSATLFCWGVTI